jgi:Zn-dependent M28 family amino/carboxypeptidase
MKELLVVLFLSQTLVAGAQKINQQTLLNDVRVLSSDTYQGRKTGTAGGQLAAEYIIQRFRDIGLTPYKNAYKESFAINGRKNEDTQGNNIIGYIPGKKKDCIVISAHYDHLGVIGGQIYNGADDNASGVSALMAFAAYFAKYKPNYTLIFAAFDAEEAGLLGSKAFVSEAPEPLSNIKLNVNMDMISHNDKRELYAAGTHLFPGLQKFLINPGQKIKLIAGHDNPKSRRSDWTQQSDEGAFYDKGIPFIYFGVEDHADYHKPTDDYENINKEFYINAVDVILEIIKRVDKEPNLNLSPI